MKLWFPQDTYLISSWTKSSEKSLKDSIDDDDENENDDASDNFGEDADSIDSSDSRWGL